MRCSKCGRSLCLEHAATHVCEESAVTRTIEFNSDWGRMVLPEGDDRMRTQAYEEFIRTVAFAHAKPSHSEESDSKWLTHKWHYALDAQLSELSGDPMTIIALTGTCGSDANNLLVQLAATWVNKDLGRGRTPKASCVLVMKESTVAARGPLAHFSSRQAFVDAAIKYRPPEVTNQVCGHADSGGFNGCQLLCGIFHVCLA